MPLSFDMEIAKAAIREGCNVDHQNKQGVTALHLAFLFDRLDFAQLLIDSGAKTYLKSNDGLTPTDLKDPTSPEVVTMKVMALKERLDSVTPDGKMAATDVLKFLEALTGSKHAMVKQDDDKPMRDEDDMHFSSEQRLDKMRTLLENVKQVA